MEQTHTLRLTEDQSSILKTLRRLPNSALTLNSEQTQDANLQTQIFSTRVLSLTQQLNSLIVTIQAALLLTPLT